MSQVRLTTLAVGTEVTDGQIIDRNSAWISHNAVLLGFKINEHRVLPDDRALIRAALHELSQRSEIIMVTGGLGPTSDDFTRDVISEFAEQPLELNESVWQELQTKLSQRGVPVNLSQRQQCFFPQGSLVLENDYGTAHGFYLKTAQQTEIFVLPGPPVEVAAVWNKSIHAMLEARIPESAREDLKILRCLGKGESDLAELTEKVMSGSGLRLGYRAHTPYVEIKVWIPRIGRENAQSYLDLLERELHPWIVNHDDEDLAETFLQKLGEKSALWFDAATGGLLTERFAALMRDRNPPQVLTVWEESTPAETWVQEKLQNQNQTFAVAPDAENRFWVVGCKISGQISIEKISPPFVYNLRSDRGRKYITEKSFQVFLGKL